MSRTTPDGSSEEESEQTPTLAAEVEPSVALQQQFDSTVSAPESAEAAVEAEVASQASILLGDRFLTAGRLSDAMEAYTAPGVDAPTEKLMALGDRYMESSRDLKRALAIYKLAGAAVPAEKLVELGRRFWNDRDYDRAISAFAAAGATEKLVALGDYCVEHDIAINYAAAAYKAAGVAEKLLQFGAYCLEKARPHEAVGAYAAAGAVLPAEKLVAVGDLCDEHGDFFKAVFAYKSAGAVEKLVALGDRLIEQEQGLSKAWLAYSSAGAAVPVEKLVELGRRFRMGWEYDSAISAFAAAGATDQLVDLGLHCLHTGRFDDGERAYKAAGLEMPKADLLICGRVSLMEVRGLDSARKAYAAAGVAIPADELMAYGNLCTKREWLKEASNAYEEAGAADKLVEIGDLWLKDGKLEAAKDVYTSAVRIQLKHDRDKATG